MTVGEAIKRKRREKNMTVGELAEKLGVSRQTVFRYENGQIATVPSDKLAAIAKVFGVTESELFGGSQRTLPFPDAVMSDNPDDVAAFPTEKGAGVAFTVKDASMVKAGIYPGDTLICRVEEVKDGAIAVYRYREKLHIARLLHDADGRILLLPEGEGFLPTVLSKDETEDFCILGHAIGTYRTL